MELGDKTFIIAEAGTAFADEKHGPRYGKALDLAVAAHRAGADAVKFQMFLPEEELFCPYPGDDERWKRWRHTHLSYDEWWSLKFAIEQTGMTFLASAFQVRAVEWLVELGVDAYKVASRAAATFPYEIAPGPFIISTGMQMPAGFIVAYWLQCDSSYPSKMGRYIPDWDGLSDHSGTVWPGLDAISRGAKILEVHFTIPELDPGPDKPVCLNTDQLKLLCEARDAVAEMHELAALRQS